MAKALIFIYLLIVPVISQAHAEEQGLPDVILITVDSLRPDHLGCYGYKRSTSPNIDRLAGKGLLFKQAVAQAPWTFPSFASIMTSLYPPKHGLLNYSDEIETESMLTKVLETNGYYTIGICANRGIAQNKSMVRGFNKFFTYNYNNKQFWRAYDAKRITKDALRQIRRNKDRRFFLWIHYMDTHGPYMPPPPYDKKWGYKESKDDSERLAVSEHVWFGFKGVPRYITFFMDISKMSKGQLISCYDGAISFIDSQIGVLLNGIDKTGINAIVIITADHGESIGEHGYFGHQAILYDELIRVPLIMWATNNIFPSKIIEQQVKSLDIMPTVLDSLKIQVPGHLDGNSLLQLAKDNGTSTSADYAFACYDNILHRYAIRTGDGWKLIYARESEKYELYDLKEDPRELNNLIKNQPAKFESLKNILLRWLNNNYTPGKKKENPADEETQKVLRSLGYLQ